MSGVVGGTWFYLITMLDACIIYMSAALARRVRVMRFGIQGEVKVTDFQWGVEHLVPLQGLISYGDSTLLPGHMHVWM